jgi:hypothetical protein
MTFMAVALGILSEQLEGKCFLFFTSIIAHLPTCVQVYIDPKCRFYLFSSFVAKNSQSLVKMWP